MHKQSPKTGDLEVFWIPQVPMKSFDIPVKDIEEAKKILTVLAEYDIFQYENNVKGDYSNAGGLVIYDADCDGEGNPGFVDWYDEEGRTIDDLMEMDREKL